MEQHYSKPKGFVGRSLCYAIYFNQDLFGHIVGGSATLNLPGRNQFFGITKKNLNNVVNNVFFRINRINDRYPTRNFTQVVLNAWEEQVCCDWKTKYGDSVIGLETLVELPRTGEIYRRNNWTEIGQTKGYTCKRIAGPKTEKWTGIRTWNYSELKPKLVFAKKT